MEIVQITSPGKIKQFKEEIEKKLNVKITARGGEAKVEGEPIEEFEASSIIEALDLGFTLKEAMKLTDENILFRKISIKQFTTKRDMELIRGRIIGTEGKTKRTIEQISGCAIVVHQSSVGIIGPAEGIEEATTAIKNLIKGSKQANVYAFLERMNREQKEKSDLGIKKNKKDEKDEEEELEDIDLDEDFKNE